MLTSAQCRERAEQKIAEAELKPRRRKKLRADAEGWLILAGVMDRVESSLQGHGTPPMKAGGCQNVPRTDRKISTAEQFYAAAGSVCSPSPHRTPTSLPPAGTGS
jgi:hypothetical protein